MQNLVRVDGLELRAAQQNILPISLYIRMTAARYTHGEGVVGENFVSSSFQPFLLRPRGGRGLTRTTWTRRWILSNGTKGIYSIKW